MVEYEHISRSSKALQTYQEKIFKYYLEKYPKLYHICYDPVGSHKRARAICNCLLGILLGTFLYVFIIADLRLGKYNSLATGLTLTALLSFGCVTSIQFRCVCLLIIPGFCGRAGRSMLKALVFGYIIAGPIFNLTFNCKEVMRSFACTGQLTYNLTKTKFDLMFRPFHQAVKNIKENEAEIRKTVESVNEMMEPIVQEIEGEDELKELEKENDRIDDLEEESQRSEQLRNKTEKQLESVETDGDYYEVKYRAKITARCEEQLSRGSERCREMFGKAYDECYKTVTWVVGWVLCWPMKLTFVCNLVQALGGNSICNPDGKIDVGLGEGYATLKESRDKLQASLKDANIKVKMDAEPIIVGMKDTARAAAGVMRDFEARKRFFNSIIGLIKRCLCLVFLKIVHNASKYHWNYLRDIEHDNVYVTPYFRKIDARRKARGSLTLLPLKKLEKIKLVDPYDTRQSKTERKNLLGQTAKLLLELMSVTVFVVLDRLLFEVLDIVRRHARLEITQEGHHELSLEILGRGLVASLVRSLVRGFNTRRSLKNVLSNEPCLPRASRLPSSILVQIYGTYFAIWLMLMLQAYSQRLRHVISAYFYRKRGKRRVLYLYNETLRRRLGYLRFARARVTRLARSQLLEPESRIWMKLKSRYPRYLGWLHYFECARHTCVVCAEVEPRRGPRHQVCQRTSGCPGVYCDECWHDVGQHCLACLEQPEDESSAADD